MSLPYESATAGDGALAELQRILARFGCQSFGTMFDAERGVTLVQFKYQGRAVSLEASWKGYAVAWSKEHPWGSRTRLTRHEHDRRALEQGRIAVCSILRDWIKGQITAIECGVLSFEAAFLPHILLPSGERLIDRIQSEKLLPETTGNVVEMKR